MAHPETDQSEIDPSEIDPNQVALITLVDGHAPYKGTWSLVRHASAPGRGLNGLEAIHTTYHPHHGPGCQIERLSLAEEQLARQFVRHLLLHNWHVHNVHPAGETLWMGLPA